MLRDILVHIESTGDGSVADFAVKLALKHDARLIGLALTPPAPQYYDAGGVAALPAFDEMELVAEAKQIFDNAVAGAALATAWRESTGPAVRDLAMHARFADLAIFNHGDPKSWFHSIANDFILTSGQPALLVPQGWRSDSVASRALVAWNATRESTKALHDALPLLANAEFVKVVTVVEDGVADEAAAAGLSIVSHLSAHGIDAELTYAEICDDPGQALLHHASENECDLLVMGLYGHSRLSELIFGGASRTVLKHMPLPVLMSH